MFFLVVDLDLFVLGGGGVGWGVWCGGCGGGGIKKSVFQVWVGVVGRIMVISAVDLELFVWGVGGVGLGVWRGGCFVKKIEARRIEAGRFEAGRIETGSIEAGSIEAAGMKLFDLCDDRVGEKGGGGDGCVKKSIF